MNKIKDFFKKNKKIIIYILVPLVVGFIGYLLGGDAKIYKEINTPVFAPPPIVFPIAWTILFVLMGISAYRISNKENNGTALKVYYVQLAVNALWSLLFFRLHLFLVSAIWIAILLILVGVMIWLFNKLDKTAALLQIPYVLWLSFAFVLNFTIYLLNM